MYEPNERDELARQLGVQRNKRMIVKCSGCGIGCYAVEPLCCFCIRCVARQRSSTVAREESGRTRRQRRS